MKQTLNQLAIGLRAVIDMIRSDAPSANFLSALGVLPGNTVEVRRVAPLGDPIAVVVDGQHISLRRADAADVGILPELRQSA